MKHFFPYIIVLLAVIVAACGEDRSGEQPFAPTVQTGTAEQVGDSVQIVGSVLTSPNSRVLERGFRMAMIRCVLRQCQKIRLTYSLLLPIP